MALFFTDREKSLALGRGATAMDRRWANERQADALAAAPGFVRPGSDTDWNHQVFENVTTVASAWRLRPDEAYARWLRQVVPALAALPEADWIGPWFRDHNASPAVGHLETAHLSAALALALDLAGDVFSPAQRDGLAAALRDKGMALCHRWLDTRRGFANWRCVLAMGVAVPAAVLDDRDALAESLTEYHRLAGLWQADGTYGESLQYGGYAAWALMLLHEALVRSGAAAALPVPYAGLGRWGAHSLVAVRPWTGWGGGVRPLSVNFNDSAALYAPPPDVLLHIAARAKATDPEAAGWARWLHDQAYAGAATGEPSDRVSFGFLPRPGFLGLALLADAAPAIDPGTCAPTPVSARFSAGPCVYKSDWRPEGRGLVAALNGVPDALNTVGHTHADLGSLVVAYDGVTLLADPGHACYRNTSRAFDISTAAHNTCHFLDADGRRLEQSVPKQRQLDADGRPGAPAERPGRCLAHVVTADRAATASVHEFSGAYGPAVRRCERTLVVAGGKALFVIDRIDTAEPLATVWTWVADNRDGGLDAKALPDRLVLRRGGAGMKLFVVPETGAAPTPDRQYGCLHDCYHPLPGMPGEGRSGSGVFYRWREAAPRAGSRVLVTAICVDGYGPVAGWHLRTDAEGTGLESPGGGEHWRITVAPDGVALTERVSGKHYRLITDNSQFTMHNSP